MDVTLTDSERKLAAEAIWSAIFRTQKRIYEAPPGTMAGRKAREKLEALDRLHATLTTSNHNEGDR